VGRLVAMIPLNCIVDFVGARYADFSYEGYEVRVASSTTCLESKVWHKPTWADQMSFAVSVSLPVI
jgi:hypothetical protein